LRSTGGPVEHRHRVELIVGFHPEDDSIADPLATLALTSTSEDPHLLDGHTVTFPEPILPGRAFRSFLLIKSPTPVIDDLNVSEFHVTFLQVVPLFASELEFKKAHSVDHLLSLWQTNRHPFWDPQRTAPTGVTPNPSLQRTSLNSDTVRRHSDPSG
jgi:suppressor of fused protein SUFU